MKKYTAPKFEVSKFAFEDIITTSGGSTEPAALTVDTTNGGVATYANGSLEFSDNNAF